MANSVSADQQFLEYLVKSLVDHPDDVTVKRIVDERGTCLYLHVNALDMGQVLGRQGSTIIAIRSLLTIVGAKHNISKLSIRVEEPERRNDGRK